MLHVNPDDQTSVAVYLPDNWSNKLLTSQMSNVPKGNRILVYTVTVMVIKWRYVKQ